MSTIGAVAGGILGGPLGAAFGAAAAGYLGRVLGKGFAEDAKNKSGIEEKKLREKQVQEAFRGNNYFERRGNYLTKPMDLAKAISVSSRDAVLSKQPGILPIKSTTSDVTIYLEAKTDENTKLDFPKPVHASPGVSVNTGKVSEVLP